MSRWEYLVVALPEFPIGHATQGLSSAVESLNREGAAGWEAVGMTPLSEGGFAVLLKRPSEA